MEIKKLPASEAQNFINQNWDDIFLLDVRTPMEFERGHLTGATNIHVQSLPSSLSQIPKDKKIICYCAHGIRSRYAAEYLLSQGYENVFHIEGGLAAVKSRGISK